MGSIAALTTGSFQLCPLNGQNRGSIHSHFFKPWSGLTAGGLHKIPEPAGQFANAVRLAKRDSFPRGSKLRRCPRLRLRPIYSRPRFAWFTPPAAIRATCGKGVFKALRYCSPPTAAHGTTFTKSEPARHAAITSRQESMLRGKSNDVFACGEFHDLRNEAVRRRERLPRHQGTGALFPRPGRFPLPQSCRERSA